MSKTVLWLILILLCAACITPKENDSPGTVVIDFYQAVNDVDFTLAESFLMPGHSTANDALQTFVCVITTVEVGSVSTTRINNKGTPAVTATAILQTKAR
jgi:hypothetical protein